VVSQRLSEFSWQGQQEKKDQDGDGLDTADNDAKRLRPMRLNEKDESEH